jgi:putative SOS response-associated peptidase YedK
MCGRLTITLPPDELALQLGLDPDALLGLTPRYNAAPTQLLPVLRLNLGGRPETAALRWGLVPTWAAAGSGAAVGVINARVETVAEKPSFRDAAALRRCLVPADGFLEWEQVAGKKHPRWFQLNGGQPFAFAALWEPPAAAARHLEGTVTILTLPATADVADFHDRMPAMLRPEQFDGWLRAAGWEAARAALPTWPAGSVTSVPVSPELNAAGVDRPELLRRVPASLFD